MIPRSVEDTTDSRPRQTKPGNVIPEESEAQEDDPADHVKPDHLIKPDHHVELDHHDVPNHHAVPDHHHPGKGTQDDSFDSDEDFGDQMFNERILDIQNTDPDILRSMEDLDPELVVQRVMNTSK